MNFNAIIAVLILKSVITEDEGERLVEHLNDKPQSTVLKDAIAAVAEVIGKPANVVQAPMGPVGPAQQAEELAARNQVANPPLPEPEPQLAAADPVVDADQAEAKPPSDSENQDKAATDEPAKPTSDDKPTQDAKKK